MTTGIYKLNFSSGAFYIGQSINIEKRFKQHCSDLRCGKSNIKMLDEYDRSGLPSYEILEDCNIESLNEIEEYYITKFSATVFPGLNILEKPGSLAVGQYSAGSKCTDDTYEKVFFLLVENRLTQDKIASMFQINRGIVKNISCGASHSWLRSKYPTEYEGLLNRVSKRHIDVRPLLQAPEGNIYDLSGQNVTEFARSHSLHKGHLLAVLNRKEKSHKGWKLASTLQEV